MKDIYVIGAMPQEVDFIHRTLGRKVRTICCGIGKINAATTTQQLISRSPDLLINIGTAAGTHPDLKVGDVVLASIAFQHDYGRMDDEVAFYRPGELPLGEASKPYWYHCEQTKDFYQKIYNLPRAYGLSQGVVASGDVFLANREKAARLYQRTHTSVVDMEAAAVAQVATNAGIAWVAIKGVSDDGTEQAKDVFEKSLERAMNHTVDVLSELIARL